MSGIEGYVVTRFQIWGYCKQMNKILIFNLDLLKDNCYKEPQDKDCFIDNIQTIIENNNAVCFMSRDSNKLSNYKQKYHSYRFYSRDEIKKIILHNKNQKYYFVIISGKEVDFRLAVNNKILFIVPTWIKLEKKAYYYGIKVDTPTQLLKFIQTLNNQYNWYSYLQVNSVTSIYSLIDARYNCGMNNYKEKELVKHFQDLLKTGNSRNYLDILFYHFIAAMTCSTVFNDIKLWGMIPSSNCSLNEDIFNFMTQIRYINGNRLPKNNMSHKNLLIRHKEKPKAHNKYDVTHRVDLGAQDEFATLKINPEYHKKINELVANGCFNVCIFDDYMSYGNSFNAVRNLLEHLGANKIIFVSIGLFRKQFIKKDYSIDGDVYTPDYTYTLKSTKKLKDFKINDNAKKEIESLYNIFNS